MAKISARGATALLTARRTDTQPNTRTVEAVYVLRSDGAVLRRHVFRTTGRETGRTGYTVWGKDFLSGPGGQPWTAEIFRAFWSSRGYAVC